MHSFAIFKLFFASSKVLFIFIGVARIILICLIFSFFLWAFINLIWTFTTWIFYLLLRLFLFWLRLLLVWLNRSLFFIFLFLLRCCQLVWLHLNLFLLLLWIIWLSVLGSSLNRLILFLIYLSKRLFFRIHLVFLQILVIPCLNLLWIQLCLNILGWIKILTVLYKIVLSTLFLKSF